jgi:hypothetical protein
MTVFLVLIPDGVKNVNTSSAIKACQIRPYWSTVHLTAVKLPEDGTFEAPKHVGVN